MAQVQSCWRLSGCRIIWRVKVKEIRCDWRRRANQPKDRKPYWCLVKQLGRAWRRDNDTLMSGVCDGVSEDDFTLAETRRTGELRNPWRLPFCLVCKFSPLYSRAYCYYLAASCASEYTIDAFISWYLVIDKAAPLRHSGYSTTGRMSNLKSGRTRGIPREGLT